MFLLCTHYKPKPEIADLSRNKHKYIGGVALVMIRLMRSMIRANTEQMKNNEPSNAEKIKI